MDLKKLNSKNIKKNKNRGYYSGKGLPFFGLGTIPGAAKPNPDIAKQAYKTHTFAGFYFEALVALHTIGAFSHATIAFSRINPLAGGALFFAEPLINDSLYSDKNVELEDMLF